MQHISIQTEILKLNCRVRYKVPYMADWDINNHGKSCLLTSYHSAAELNSRRHAGSISSHTSYKLPRHRKQISSPSSGAFCFPHKICCQRKGVQNFFPSTSGLVSLCYINGNCRCTSTQMLTSSNSRKGYMHLGRKKNPSAHAILALKGKCAVEKEGMIGEIKLKCRKKNISNRRELLPVVLAKPLSWCSVRIHRCAGSPADCPNTMPSCQGPGKLSCNCSLRELSTEPSSDLGGSLVPDSPRLAAQPGAFLQYLLLLLPDWPVAPSKVPRVVRGCRAASLPGTGCSGDSLPGTWWQTARQAVCSHSPSCLLRPTELPKHCQPTLESFPEPYHCALQPHFQLFHQLLVQQHENIPIFTGHLPDTPGLYLHWQRTANVWTPKAALLVFQFM